MKLMLVLATTSALASFACKTLSESTSGGALKGVSYIYKIDGSMVNADIDHSGIVKFYMSVQGKREDILSIDDSYTPGTIKATKDKNGNFIIKWLGVAIGEKRGDKAEICGPIYGYTEICDATFIQRDQNSSNGKNLMILGLLEKGFRMLPQDGAMNSGEGFNLTDSPTQGRSGPVDISNFATTEFNQNGTGTCLYNSTTGIVEWYRNRDLGKVERLSAPYILGTLFENSTFSGERGAVNETNRLKDAALDTVFPTQQTYDMFTSFDGAYQYSQTQAGRISQGRVKFPAIKTKELFMLSQPAMGAFGAQGATVEQMGKVRDWIVNKKRPVHFFHYYHDTGIWHAVMALGWDDSRQLIKIKDSLSRSGQAGQWKSISTYRTMAYGALGTEEVNSAGISPDRSRDNQGNKENEREDTSPQAGNSNTTTPSNNNDESPSTQGPTTDNGNANLRWAAIIQGSTMYIYVSEYVTDVSIRGYGNVWLPTTDSYQPQSGIPVIRGIFINRASWMPHTSVDVRVMYNGKYVAVSVPLTFY